MTSAEAKTALAQRAANPNLVSFLLWLSFMTMLIGEGQLDWQITGAQWIYLSLIGGMIGDVAKIVAGRLTNGGSSST